MSFMNLYNDQMDRAGDPNNSFGNAADVYHWQEFGGRPGYDPSHLYANGNFGRGPGSGFGGSGGGSGSGFGFAGGVGVSGGASGGVSMGARAGGGSGGGSRQASALRASGSGSPRGGNRRSFIGVTPGMGGGGGGDAGPNYTRGGFQNPSNVTATTEVDPREGYAYDRAKDYESGLAAGTNEEITRELSRARDDLSVGMRAEGEAAMGRGADPGLFRSRALEAGKRDIHNLQGRLADVALGRRGEAIRTLTGAAGQAASGIRSTHFGSLAARLADQRYQLDAAEAQARLQQAPYDRMMRMMDQVGRYGGMIGGGGMTGGGGGGVGLGSISGGLRLGRRTGPGSFGGGGGMG